MDLNHLLIWTVASGCFILLLQLAGQKNAARPALIAVSILVTLVICHWLLRDSAGFICGTLFILLLVIPSWLGEWIHMLLLRRQYLLASWLARMLSVLYPDGETKYYSRLIHAMHLMKIGRGERAVAVLSSIPAGTSNGRMAIILRTRYQGNWKEILNWATVSGNMNLIQKDLNLCDTYLQALGETGQRAEMFSEYHRLLPMMRGLPGDVLSFIRAKIAAFSGDEFAVAQWLSGPLRDLPIEIRRYWRATAVYVSGRIAEAETDFRWIIEHSDPGIAGSAQRRLSDPLMTVQESPLTDREFSTLREISADAEFAIQHGSVQLGGTRRNWATWLIAAVLLIVFLFEIPGGSENTENLERMGAMLIPATSDTGESWRMVAAAFLHFGPIHLVMNLLGLIILGRVIERTWGGWLTLISYLMSAIGAIGLAPYVIALQGEPGYTALVGASGGVMGLLGGLLIQTLFNFLRNRTLPAFKEFAILLVIVIIQMAFDANTPNVSSEAHLLGMSIGIFCGTVWNLVWWGRAGWKLNPRSHSQFRS